MAEPESVGLSAERLQRVSALAEEYVETGKVAGMVTMVNRGGKLVHFEVTGDRGVDDARRLQRDDLFRIYSMTKPITAIAAMQLYEQGKFSLNDSISKFVPELSDLMVLNEAGELEKAEDITMHHLLTHTAGFSYGFNLKDPVDKLYRQAELWIAVDLSELAERLAKLPLQYQPGSRWHYSVAVDITGLVIERISGISFDQYLSENVFKPLGMNDTFFEVPKDKLSRLLPNHRWDAKQNKLAMLTGGIQELGVPDENLAMVNCRQVSLYSGGRGLVSTARDYMRFAEMLRNGGRLGDAQIIGTNTLQYMTRDHLTAVTSADGEDVPSGAFGFGLGFGLIVDSVKQGTMSAEGTFFWGGAAGTTFWVDPVEDIVGLAMIQAIGSRASLTDDLGIAIYQAITDSD